MTLGLQPRSVKIIRLKQLQEKLGDVSKATIYRWVHEGRLPLPLKLGARASGWVEHEVDEKIVNMPRSKIKV